MLGSHQTSQTTAPLWYSTMDPDRPGPHLASGPRRVGQAVTHLLILNRKESVNVNLGKDVSMGHTPAFWARTESEQPSRSIRGTKADKAAGGFVNQPMTWLTSDCKEMIAHVYLLDLEKAQLAKKTPKPKRKASPSVMRAQVIWALGMPDNLNRNKASPNFYEWYHDLTTEETAAPQNSSMRLLETQQWWNGLLNLQYSCSFRQSSDLTT